jgi:putative endonuclease
MYHTYILKSSKNSKYYIGYTHNLANRLSEHNKGRVSFTKLHRPWVIYYSEDFESEREAVLRERQIKSWKSRAMIEKLKLKLSRGSSIL